LSYPKTSTQQQMSSVADNQVHNPTVFQDPASTTAELLYSIWRLIVAAEEMERGEERSIIYPNLADKLSDGGFVSRVMAHLDNCRDVCDDFGISMIIIPMVNEKRIPIGFTVKSYTGRLSLQNPKDANDETGGYIFHNDDLWNDDLDFDFTPEMLMDEDDEDEDELLKNSLPDDTGVTDEDMVQITKKWVDTMMSNMGVCPFTSGPDMAGLPLGKVFYTVDRMTKVEHVYVSYWRELVRMEQSNESDLSTTLLILPEFALHNVEFFENLSTTLTQPLGALELERLTQLVFFHPRWTFRDGGANRAGGDTQSANYARRSPWPMINLLRTSQVRAAQKGIPTGLVYSQNEKTLSAIGTEKLETMLQERDWKGLSGAKVNRREHDALSMAQDMQVLADNVKDGEEAAHKVVKDTVGKGYDKHAAVNKVDQSQIDRGDLVNVLKQALQKRLDGNKLTGAETSAALMATDFLIEELDRIAAQGK